ncbi:MAG TPA: CHASE3 domain-containing protein [Azospirillaceae bacterium]|nr:CHASE3 domain-containing protein [Azospirillaceae bacterium]
MGLDGDGGTGKRDTTALRSRLRWGMILAVVAVIGLVGLLQLVFHQVLSREDWVRHTHEVRVAIERTYSSLKDAHGQERSFVLLGLPEARTGFDEAREALARSLDELESLTRDNPLQQQRLVRLRSEVDAELARMNRSMSLAAKGDMAGAAAVLGLPEFYSAASAIREMIRTMEQTERDLLAERARRVEWLRRLFEIGGVAAALMAVGLMALEYRRIRRSLKREERLAAEMRDLLQSRTVLLEERTALLREINHRVGNSLAMISTLVEMQARQLSDPQALQALSDTRNRVSAVGQVHRRLQKTEAVAALDFGEYVTALCADLTQGLGFANAVDVDAEAVQVPVEAAVPLALVVNELVTNAATHGHGTRPDGHVSLAFHRENGTLSLVVSDNGPGLPRGFRVEESTGLGMTILRALAQQLDARLSFTNAGHGTEARLEMPLPV